MTFKIRFVYVSVGDGSCHVGRDEAADVGEGVGDAHQGARVVGREVDVVHLGK